MVRRGESYIGITTAFNTLLTFNRHFKIDLIVMYTFSCLFLLPFYAPG